MRRTFVAGNWKMNGSSASNAALLDDLLAGVRRAGIAELAIFPPFVYLPQVAAILAESAVSWGGQTISEEAAGAFTGEVSASMLVDLACRYCLVGHSERRTLYGETDELVASKYGAAQQSKIIPILCVGETLDEREGNEMEEVIARQLDAVIAIEGVESFANAVVAYEPVWAIGTGKTASPQQAQDVHEFIRGKFSTLNATIGGSLRVLYGGSVKAANAAELFAMPDIDGGLIGGASLDAEEFLQIAEAAG